MVIVTGKKRMDQVKKGIELRNQGKFSAAEKIFLRAVEEAGLVHGKTSEAYAVTLKSLAILRFEEQRWVEAAKLFQQCNEIFKRVRNVSEDRAMILDYLVQSNWLAGDLDAAREYAKQALVIMKILKMESHPKYGEIAGMLGMLNEGIEAQQTIFGIMPKVPSSGLQRTKKPQATKKEKPQKSNTVAPRSLQEHLGTPSCIAPLIPPTTCAISVLALSLLHPTNNQETHKKSVLEASETVCYVLETTKHGAPISSVPQIPKESCTEITFSEMQLNKRYIQRKLTTKLVDKPFLRGSLHLLIEVANAGTGKNSVTRLSLSGAHTNEGVMSSPSELAKVYPAGLKVTIYHPFWKVFQDGFDGIRLPFVPSSLPSSLHRPSCTITLAILVHLKKFQIFVPPSLNFHRVDDPTECVFHFSEYFKEQGNTALKKSKFEESIDHYTTALTHDQKNHTLFSNRSLAYGKLQKWSEAEKDARQCIELVPRWQKGYYRLACAELAQKKKFDALRTLVSANCRDKESVALIQKIVADLEPEEAPVEIVPIPAAPRSPRSPPKTFLSWAAVNPIGTAIPALGEHTCTLIGNSTVMIWGGHAGVCPTRGTYFYDPLNNKSWRPRPAQNEPELRQNHRVTVCGNSAWFIGGVPDSGVFRYSTKTLQWDKPKIRGALPKNLGSFACCVNGEKIFIYGGFTPEKNPANVHDRVYHNTLYILDTKNLSWSQVIKPNKSKQWPSYRAFSFFAPVDDRHLVLFGGEESASSVNSETWLFDIQKLTWLRLTPKVSPPAIGIFGQAPLTLRGSNHVTHHLFVGGCAISGHVNHDIWIFSHSTLEWTFVPTLDVLPRVTAYQPFVVGDYLYIFGGYEIIDRPVPIDRMLRFPIQDAISEILEKSEIDQATGEGTTWKCLGCQGFSQRKCSRCGVFPFCSKECEELGREGHQTDCHLAGGIEDPTLVKLREKEAKISELEKNIHQANNNVVELNQKLLQEASQKRVLEEEAQRKNKKAQNLEKAKEALTRQIKEAKKVIQEKEAQQNQEKVRTKELSQEVENLKQRKRKLEDLLSSNQRKNQELEREAKEVQEKLRDAAETTKERLKELQEELQSAEKVKHEKIAELEKEKEVQKSLQDNLEESKLCGICFENEKSKALVPCGHVFCSDCVIVFGSTNCPICREKITNHIKLFLS